MNCIPIKNLATALVKSSTTKPATRTPIMPLVAFDELFRSWEDNNGVSLKDLRLKAITLLAIAFMTRPSDLAPRGQYFDPSSNSCVAFTFSRDQLMFHEDGSLTVTFFGIKNDSSRTGFEVRIPKSSSSRNDVVDTLKTYLNRTKDQTTEKGPVFISLNKPYKGITATTVSKVLSESISLAGLSDKGFTPKCFRPSAANAAIKSGCDAETAMHVGRWKTKDVFYDHYVHAMAPSQFTSDAMRFSGLQYD